MKYIDISTHPHQNRQCQWPPTTSLHYRLTTTFQNLLRPKDTPRKLIYSYLGKRNNIIKNDLEGEMVVPWSVYLAGLFWRNEYSFELSWLKLPPHQVHPGTSRVEREDWTPHFQPYQRLYNAKQVWTMVNTSIDTFALQETPPQLALNTYLNRKIIFSTYLWEPSCHQWQNTSTIIIQKWHR